MDADRDLREPAGAITIEEQGAGRRVLCLSGTVDTAVATQFKAAHGRARPPVDAIDAGAVTFICSSGLALLVMYAEASAAVGRPAVLRSASRPVERALQMAGIDSLFPRTGQGAAER